METKINIEKLAKIGIEMKQGNMHRICFKNLQRFVDYKLSKKGMFSQYNASLTYSVKDDKWFGNNAFNKAEKAEMIQAILNYTPSDDEVKEIPYEIAETPMKKLTGEELVRSRRFDARNDGDSDYYGF